MIRLLSRVLVFALVPVLVVTTGRAADAATNLNPWVAVDARSHANDALVSDIWCRIAARYLPDGAGIEWSESNCIRDGGVGGLDLNPGATAPEQGSDYTLTFTGTHAGAPLNEAPVNVALDSPYVEFTTYSGLGQRIDAGPLTWSAKNLGPSNRRPGREWFGYNVVTQEFVTCGSSTGGTAYPPGYVWSYSETYCGGRSGPDWRWAGIQQRLYVSSGAEANVTEKILYQFETTGGGGSTPNQGEGDPCSFTSSGQMGDSPDDSWWHPAGTIPAGSAPLDVAAKGACLVTDVCVDFGDDYNVCGPLALGTPVGQDDTGTVPDTLPPPPLGLEDEPTADTEQGFWDGLLGMIAWLGRKLIGGLAAVVDAVGALGATLLAGIGALLIPGDGFLDGKVEQVKDAWDDTPPGVLLGTVTSLPGKLAIPESMGCQGPELEVKTPSLARANGTSAADKNQSLHLFSTCEPARENLADLVRIGLSILVVVGGLLVSVRVLGASIGVDTGLGKSGDGS